MIFHWTWITLYAIFLIVLGYGEIYEIVCEVRDYVTERLKFIREHKEAKKKIQT